MSTRTAGTLRRRQTHFASKHVFTWMDKVDAKGKSLLAKSAPRLQGLPIELRSYGLSVVLATLLREGRDESKAIAACLAEWLLDESPLELLNGPRATDPESYKPVELLRQVVDADRETRGRGKSCPGVVSHGRGRNRLRFSAAQPVMREGVGESRNPTPA